MTKKGKLNLVEVIQDPLESNRAHVKEIHEAIPDWLPLEHE